MSSLRPVVLLLLFLFFLGMLVGQTYWITVYKENLLPIELDRMIFLVTSLIALYFTVRHFSLSVKPLLTYEYNMVENSEMGLKGKVFQVKLKNAGNGVGVFYDIHFEAKLAEQKASILTKNPMDIVVLLAPLGFRRYLNYNIFFARPGYTLASKEERVVFEMSPTEIGKIQQLDMRLRIESILGNRFEKWVFCIPREKELSLPAAIIT